MNKLKYISILLLLPSLLFAQEPKRELRAVWVATVANIDWPSTSDYGNAAAQKEDLIAMLDLYQETNINTIFLQVRPACDALYQSAYEPWSKYLTGTQGSDPGYDPLQFAIEEGHKRGIEVHGWVNPYRVSTTANPTSGDFHETHIFREHPEWTFKNDDGKYILNPGRPEVMSYIGDVIEDIVSNYDIDGIHFDDYFYAYGGTSSTLDETEYNLYGGSMSLGDWRRDNINRMIDTVYTRIQKANSNVRFGVSPFGIWRPGTPPGINGMDAWATIYCDPLAWLDDLTVDYITPQLYWPTGGSQDFETLVAWWDDQVTAAGRHLYPGMGTYRLSSNPGLKKATQIKEDLHEHKAYFDDISLYSELEQSLLKGTSDPVSDWTLSEIGKQIGIIREAGNANALGSVFFSAKDLTRVSGLQEYLLENSFTQIAIVPEMTWKNDPSPITPSNIRIEEINSDNVLSWDYTVENNVRFAIYASTESNNATDIINDPANIQALTFTNSISTQDLSIFENAFIVITAITAAGKESSPSAVFSPSGDFPYVTIIAPGTGSILKASDNLRWSSEYTDPTYQLQIATNSSFGNIIYTSDWISSTTFTIEDANLDGDKKYFWRARVNNGTIGPFSGSRYFFTGFPVSPELLSPVNLSQNIYRNPLVKWEASESTEDIRIQLSIASSFETVLVDEVFDATLKEAELAYELDKDTWYYLRIIAENSYGASAPSDFISFSTTAGEVPEISLSAPANLATAGSFDNLDWEISAGTGTITCFLEVALDEGFSTVMYNSGWISETEIEIESLKLEGNRTYFWHVKAKSEFGESGYTESRSYYAGYPTRPTITKPANLSSNVSPKPVIGWSVDEDTDNVYVEISEESSFDYVKHSDTFAADPAESQITASLGGNTGYYLRLRAENEYGGSVFSATKHFETGEGNAVEVDESNAEPSVYPSIVSMGEFFVENNSADQIHAIEVIDMTGRVWKTLANVERMNTISMSTQGLPNNSSLYVRIRTTSKVFVTPIMIIE